MKRITTEQYKFIKWVLETRIVESRFHVIQKWFRPEMQYAEGTEFQNRLNEFRSKYLDEYLVHLKLG